MSVDGDDVVISDYKTLCDRYANSINDVATPEVHRVFTWLYKGGERYVGEYWKSISESTFNELKRDIKKKLEDKMPTEDMDITTLYSLLQNTCALSPPTADIWHKPLESQTESIEHSLYLLKKKRNELAHEYQILKKMSEDELVSKINEVNNLCRIILTEAGNKRCEIQDAALAIEEMEIRFKKVTGVDARLIAKLGRLEKQAKPHQQMEFYASPILTYKGDRLQLSDIITELQKDDSKSTIIFLRGDAGSGKSALCQYLDCQWIADEEKIRNLQDYDLLLLFKCREVCTPDLIRLLQDDLLPDTMKYCDPYKILELLQDLRILWIIDGLEEATKAATDLIHWLLKKGTSTHTFLLASRPEFIYSITKTLKHHEYTEVTLCGVKPKDLFQSKRMSAQTYMLNSSELEGFISDLDRFMSDFDNFDQNIQNELQNPLKLGVVLKSWNKAHNKLSIDSSLPELYEILVESRIELLAEKLARGMVTKDDASRKVKRWFDYFCKIAYDLTAANHILIITTAKLEDLKMKCDELQIPSAMCLSEFLTSHDQRNYQFLHSTQQYHLAAIYAAKVFKSTTCTKQENATDENMKYPYEILLHMVPIFQGSLDEDQVNFLIQLFECTIDTENATPKWFEVIRIANYHISFLKTISKVIPEWWFISDQNIEAATRLINHKPPKQAVIKLDNNPINSGVEDLLCTLAKSESRIFVKLYLEYHFWLTTEESDRFIKIICENPSMCSILEFSGHLSEEGCKLLNSDNIKNNCQVLKLNVSSPKSLSTIYHNVRKYKKMSSIELIFTFLNYGLTNIKGTPSAFKDIIVDLHLYNLLDNQVHKAAKLIQNLGQNFNNIIIYRLSKSGAQDFVELLQKKVRANALLRPIVNTEKMKMSLVNFGPLPLIYSTRNFIEIWVRSEKQN